MIFHHLSFVSNLLEYLFGLLNLFFLNFFNVSILYLYIIHEEIKNFKNNIIYLIGTICNIWIKYIKILPALQFPQVSSDTLIQI